MNVERQHYFGCIPCSLTALDIKSYEEFFISNRTTRVRLTLTKGGFVLKTGLAIFLILTAVPRDAEGAVSGPARISAPYAPRATAQPQTADQDCEKIKQDIEQLQQELAAISVEMQRLTELLDQVNQDVAKTQADLKTATGLSNAGITNETIRGQLLDTLAKLLSTRKQVKQQLEDDALTIQAIKDEIAGLLSKLANCAPPSSTQPPQQETPQAQPPCAPAPSSPKSAPTQPAPNKSVSMSGFTPTIQLRGFGGASFINGNAPPTAGFDGAVLFPLGNRVLLGPSAGFQWVDSSIIKTIGGGPPPSTFINTSVGFKSGNFGGRIGFPLAGFELGIQGGATVAGSTITQATGFCGTGGPTAPAGCTVTSSTTTHDTVVGPFVGGYISHSIFSHVGVFVEYDSSRFKDTKPNATNPTGPSVSVFDLHSNDVVAGLVLSFGRHRPLHGTK